MRKKLFKHFLIVALVMFGVTNAWAGSQNFTSFNQGNNTKSPVTVNCAAVNSNTAVLKSGKNIIITVSTGYEVKSMAFDCEAVDRKVISTTPAGLLQDAYPTYSTYANNINSSSFTMSTSGQYSISLIDVNYAPVNYTITYNLNDGSVSGNPTSYNIETNTFTLKNPTRSGYTFTGWTGSNGSTKQTSVSITKGSTGNKSYTANWQANTYTVSYNANGGTGTTASQTKTHGVTLQLRSNGYSRTGYTFSKWNTKADGKGTNYNAGANYTANAAATMYAQWTANTYKVKFYGNGNTGGSMSDQNFTYGTAQNLTANGFSKTGHTFAGWATSPTDAKVYNNQQSVNNLTATNGGTFNLYAKWTVNQYTITFNNYDGTQLQSSQVNYGATPTYTGATPTKPSTAAYTYTFNGWNPAIATVTGAATYTAQFTEQINQATVDAVIAQINAIGSPITAASQSAITSARTAYNALTAEQKALVTNYTTLTDAEAALAVVNLINAIGSPITADSQTAIDAARNAYDNLTDDQKALVGNLSTLTNAEAALAVVNQIAAIGEVTLSSGSAIADVRTAYDALTGDQQALVGNYATLTAAEAAYNTLVADHAAADAVIAQINAIASPITAASQTAIEEARGAYNALTDTQKGYVTNYSELTDAEAALVVVNLINAIDDPVVYTAACHDEITDARTAYEALTAEQKALVDATTLQVLTDAEAAYAALEADHNAANAVINLINAIGSPITAASQSAVEAARNAYDNLTDDQKALVGNLSTLTDAEAALAVVNQIAAIGEVTLSSGSAIADVRTAYDALTGDQQALVGNYATLTAAEAAYNTLVADHAAADAVIAQINAIGSPITATSQTAIEEARTAYNALTDTQKGYVTNYSELTDAEAALVVVNLINAIDDPVVYTAACHDEITDARTAYEALTAEQKALVDATTLQKLTDAEAAYDALEADHNAANAVIDLINAIDDPVVYTDACHQEILDAREAYNNLTQAQKDLIDASTLQKLTDAEDAYASLNVDITAKADPVNPGVYYSTFYDGSRQLQLPANVEAYTATVSGDKMLLKKVAVPGDILPAATAVVLRASQADFTLTPSAASPVSVENNALRGTDVNMGVPSDHCYVLSGADGFVGFYPLSTPYTLTAHKAYIDLDNLPGGANNAPRRLRFVFSEEQTATGMENVQNEETKAQKVMIDGVMYIIRGEHMYDAQGQIVK